MFFNLFSEVCFGGFLIIKQVKKMTSHLTCYTEG